MQEYLDASVKQVIDEHPAVEAILDEFGIGCGPCSVGDCLLKDIVQIHNLGPEQEKALMARIIKTIDPDADVVIPETAAAKAEKKEIRYSPPVRKLVEEHKLIKRCVAQIPSVIEYADLETEEGRELVRATVDFIRNYADRYHHAKEEDILFGYFDSGLEILQVMHKEHETGRSHVRAVLQAVDNRDQEAVRVHLSAYRDLLQEHIRKEDEILYPWMDNNMSTGQVGELFRRFGEVDAEFGDTEEKYREFVENLEQRFCGAGPVEDRTVAETG